MNVEITIDSTTISVGLGTGLSQVNNIKLSTVKTVGTYGDYATLNSAISDGIAKKIFMLSGTQTLTDNITMPEGSTLQFDIAAKLSGAYTITGNKTNIETTTLQQIFDTDISFAGSFNIKSVSPELFGAVGDGITNEDNPFSKAIELALLNNNKNLTLYSKSYLTTAEFDIGGLNILGSNTILNRTGTNKFSGEGSISSFSNLTADATIRDSYIDVSHSFALSVSVGDLVKLLSDEICIPASSEDVRFGEIHKITEIDLINDILYFQDYLFRGYSLSDNGRVAKVTPVRGSFKGCKIKFPSDTTIQEIGLHLKYVEDYEVDLSVESAYRTSFQISDCYNGNIKAKTSNSIHINYGYGVWIGGASMYTTVEGVFIGHRHCFTTGGTGTAGGADVGGVPWGIIVKNSIGTNGINGAGCFDTHASSGLVTFDNCMAIGGKYKDNKDTADWDVGTAYVVSDVVVRNEWLYRCVQNNTGEDPDTDTASEYWEWKSPNNSLGFNTEGLNVNLNNCKAINLHTGLNNYSVGNENVHINGFYCKNVLLGVYSPSTNNSESFSIQNLVHENDFNFLKSYALQLSGNADRLVVNNISAKNCRPVFFSANTGLPEEIVMMNIVGIRESSLNSTEDIGIVIGVPIPSNYSFSNIFIKNMAVLRIPSNVGYGTIDSVVLNNVENYGNITYAFDIQQETTKFVVNNFVNDSLASSLLYVKNGIDEVVINGSYSCENLFQMQATIAFINTYMAQGGEITDANDYDFYNNFRGQNSYPIEKEGRRILKGYQTPENYVTANIGTMYIRRTDGTLYMKNTGTGNTGWVEK